MPLFSTIFLLSVSPFPSSSYFCACVPTFLCILDMPSCMPSFNFPLLYHYFYSFLFPPSIPSPSLLPGNRQWRGGLYCIACFFYSFCLCLLSVHENKLLCVYACVCAFFLSCIRRHMPVSSTMPAPPFYPYKTDYLPSHAHTTFAEEEDGKD